MRSFLKCGEACKRAELSSTLLFAYLADTSVISRENCCVIWPDGDIRSGFSLKGHVLLQYVCNIDESIIDFRQNFKLFGKYSVKA